jgi:hypothetical protein
MRLHRRIVSLALLLAGWSLLVPSAASAVPVPSGTCIDVRSSAPVAPFASTVQITGVLIDRPTLKPVAGAVLELFASSNGRDFSRVASRTTQADGTVTIGIRMTKKLFFRFKRTDSATDASESGIFTQQCLAAVDRPTVNPTVYPSSYFQVAGYMYPHHPEGTKPIKLLFDRWEGGRWVLRKTAEPAVSDVDGKTQYHCLMPPLGLLGSWRVRAVHEDWGHARTESKPALIVVQDAPVPTRAIAWVADHYPSQGTTVTVYARAFDQFGKPYMMRGATFTWRFATWTRSVGRFPWKADGVMFDAYRIGALEPGRRVVVDVSLYEKPDRVLKASTWLEPRDPGIAVPTTPGDPKPKPLALTVSPK